MRWMFCLNSSRSWAFCSFFFFNLLIVNSAWCCYLTSSALHCTRFFLPGVFPFFFFKFKWIIHCQLFTGCFVGCVSPPDLGRIALPFKVSVTFGFTKPEHLALVEDEHHAASWGGGPGRETALLWCMWAHAGTTTLTSSLLNHLLPHFYVRFIIYYFIRSG